MTNPYVYQEPLQGRQGFYNRVSELVRASSRITADRPQSVAIVGGPRTGKTSLLRRLCDPSDLAEPARYVLLYLGLKAASPRHPDAFFAQVDLNLRQAGHAGMAPGYDGFNQLVKQLMQEGRKLVLFCDDFDLVTRNPRFSVDFFSFLRSVANSHDVGYVTTSRAPLPQLSHLELEESPFFNIFTTVTLEPFAAEAARQLVEEPACQVGAPFAGEVEWILRLGGASPYLLQLSAGLAFAARAQGLLTEEELGAQAFRQARRHLSLLWEVHFSSGQQEVLQALTAGQAVDRRHEHAAEALERQGYLRRQGTGYVFSSALLERHVRELGQGGWWRRLLGG